MQARRAARELAFILFSQFDKKITNYSKDDLENIILKSVRILTSNASDELKIDRSDITKCCKGKKKSAGGFMWSYESE